MKTSLIVIGMAALAALAFIWPIIGRDRARYSRPGMDAPATAGTQTLVVAGGCFWGVQGVFQHVAGVTSAVSGYAGGEQATAHYEMVGSGRTGPCGIGADHLRSAQGQPTASCCRSISRWRTTRPSSTGRAPTSARNTARRSSPMQRRAGESGARPISSSSMRPSYSARKIVTTIERGQTFYPAEDYHQDYLTLHPSQPYIVYQRSAEDRESEAAVSRRFIAPSRCWSPRPAPEDWAAARGAGRAPADRGRAATAACGPARGDASGD